MKIFAFRPATLVLASVITGAALGCGSQTPSEKLMDAQNAYNAGDIQAAIDLVGEVLAMPEIDPATWGHASYWLAQFRLQAQDVAGAQETFKSIQDTIGIENENPALAEYARQALIARVQIQDQMGQGQEALDLVLATSDTLTAESPFSRQLTYISSVLRLNQGLYEEAFHDVQSLIQTETQFEAIPDLLGQAALIRQSEGRFDEAAQVFLDFIDVAQDPRFSPELIFQAAMVYPPPEADPDVKYQARRKELFERAGRELEALRSSESDPTMKSRVGIMQSTVALSLGDRALATDHLTSVTQSLATAPEVRAMAMTGMAELHLHYNEHDEALAQYYKVQEEFGLESAAGQHAQQGIIYTNRLIADEAIRQIETEPGAPSAPGSPATADEEGATSPTARDADGAAIMDFATPSAPEAELAPAPGSDDDVDRLPPPVSDESPADEAVETVD